MEPQREVRLSISIKCSDEALQIANAHLNLSNDHVVRDITDGKDILSDLMDRAFNVFLSD